MSEPRRSPSVAVHPSAGSVLVFGPFSFDRANQILWRGGEEVKLPPRALAVLDILLERRGAVVSKRALLDSVWRDTHVTETSLSEAVSLLRQALNDSPQRPTFIATAHRRGYRFLAQVTVAAQPRPTRKAPESFLAPAGASTGPASVEADVSPVTRGARRAIPAAVLAALVLTFTLGVVLGSWRPLTRHQIPPTPTRTTIQAPEDVSLASFVPSLAIDAGGRTLVFVGHAADDSARLYRRRLDSFGSSPIAGTEGARSPFFSPDGRHLGFIADGQLVRIPLEGGVGVPLCKVAKPLGASWGDTDTIVFSPAVTSGLSQVPASGGQATTLTQPLATAGEVGHWWPEFLPGRNAVLYTIWTTTLETAKLALLSLDAGESRVLLEGASNAHYVASGHLVYAAPGGVLAVPFDLDSLELTGPPFEIADQAAISPPIGLVQLVVAASGTMIHLPQSAASRARELVLVGPAGSDSVLPTAPFLFRNMDLDPTGRMLAVTVLEGARSDVWVSPLPSLDLTRSTFEGFNIEPRWTPDGSQLAFASNRGGPFNIYRAPAGGGPAVCLIDSVLHQYPQSWAPDGRFLVYVEASPETGFDIWILDLEEDRRYPYLRTPHDEVQATLSPDGRWLAYESDETGQFEVYLRSFPEAQGPWQVSERGGREPFWSADGTRVHFWDGPKLFGIEVDASGGLRLGARGLVMNRHDLEKARPYPGSERFMAIRESRQDPRLTEIRVVTGWSGLLPSPTL